MAPDHRHEPGRDLGHEPLAHEQHDQHPEGDGHAGQADVGQVPAGVGQLAQGVEVVHVQAEHVRHLGDGHLHADAGQEPDQHGARQEVGQEAEAQEPGQQQQHAGHQRGHAGQRHPVRRPGSEPDQAQPGQPGEQDGGGGRVGGHHQMARRPEQGEGQDRAAAGCRAR